MLTVVDYGMGNLRSIVNAVSHLGFEARISGAPEEVAAASKLILPGVGSFRQAMQNIHSRHLFDPLNEAVKVRGASVLGICLGMQLLSYFGHEDGGASGLGWIQGEVVPFRIENPAVRLPHVGFNSVWATSSRSRMFGALVAPTDFYFVHGFTFQCADQFDVAAWCDYQGQFVAAVERDNVFGTQFHPEKSQSGGLALLDRFLRI